MICLVSHFGGRGLRRGLVKHQRPFVGVARAERDGAGRLGFDTEALAGGVDLRTKRGVFAFDHRADLRD